MSHDSGGSPPKQKTPQDHPRRAFMATAVSGAIGAVVAVPAIGYLLHPLRKDTVSFDAGETWLGPVERFAVGQPRKVAITADRTDGWVTTRDVTIGSVWVVRGEDGFKVFNTTCPHLGCAINEASEGFRCPCHNSRFTVTGERVEQPGHQNPAPRDMDEVPSEVRDGVLYCTYQTYKIGTSEKVKTS